eukprot:TRINITY_DN10201_c0_g1_i1.p1 TRINITY_DN10201_c0_g1~~TRINITY_DN10201_c0_g1_i1.p1  ORF type:complete len:140 (+),score=3.22 TRINITY_DN10201_c0_g1_i1:134-553(+)
MNRKSIVVANYVISSILAIGFCIAAWSSASVITGNNLLTNSQRFIIIWPTLFFVCNILIGLFSFVRRNSATTAKYYLCLGLNIGCLNMALLMAALFGGLEDKMTSEKAAVGFSSLYFISEVIQTTLMSVWREDFLSTNS